MEDFYINNTSVDKSYNYSNIKSDYERNISNYMKLMFIEDVVMYIIISIGLPLTLVAIYGLYSQVRNGHVAPIYIINLLISDLIQFCSFIVFVATPEHFLTTEISNVILAFGLMVSICFMVCISLERYLVIAWPLWYRFRRTIKTSVVVCVMFWIFTLVCNLVVSFSFSEKSGEIIYGVLLLLPFPLFIFSLCGTIKALSAASSVPPDEKRRIVAVLVLVLLTYTLLFLPLTITYLAGVAWNHPFTFVSFLLIRFSPLADLFLYVFSRKGAVDRFLACVCGCRMNSDSDISMNDVNL